MPAEGPGLVRTAKNWIDGGAIFLSNQWGGPKQLSVESSPTENVINENAGIVMVYDIITKKPIAHFRAHRAPITYMAFDPSGTLLVTSAEGGYDFKVFQIIPSEKIQKSYRLIYTLTRGSTSAIITHVSFTDDSRWMAASSDHGTTHIFAINAEGGSVNIYTHIPSQAIPKHDLPFLQSVQEAKHITLAVSNRVKPPIAPEESRFKIPYSTNASVFIQGTSTSNGKTSTNQNVLRLLSVSTTGLLLESNLNPRPPREPEIDPKTLVLDVQPTWLWEIQRREKWDSVDFKRPSAESDSKKSKQAAEEMKWLANIEITTHLVNGNFRPLCAGPQFAFKPYKDGHYEHHDDALDVSKEAGISTGASSPFGTSPASIGFGTSPGTSSSFGRRIETDNEVVLVTADNIAELNVAMSSDVFGNNRTSERKKPKSKKKKKKTKSSPPKGKQKIESEDDDSNNEPDDGHGAPDIHDYGDLDFYNDD
eukprot:TRINITY_DN1085_c0_g1_i2.p1 TRINITY_DN1085_c0_g1~~TRINITY_DN1085_c0_g1_i2.p1  ORF type:complete len:478 (+),score=114.64 TRINITY_DN1085_c0_g1_i2:197-1630(+)